jgi:hypothetical protein
MRPFSEFDANSFQDANFEGLSELTAKFEKSLEKIGTKTDLGHRFKLIPIKSIKGKTKTKKYSDHTLLLTL